MRVSPVISDSLKELSIIDMDRPDTDKPPKYKLTCRLRLVFTLAYLFCYTVKRLWIKIVKASQTMKMHRRKSLEQLDQWK